MKGRSQISDEEVSLLQAARAGDAVAFEHLAGLHRPRLYRIALRRTRSAADAEDAVQETLIKAWTALGSFREESKFSTWTTRILFNEIFQLQRRGDYRRLDFPESLSIVEADAFSSGRMEPLRTPEEQCVQADARAYLYRAVSKLPGTLRQVLQLDLEGRHTCNEIAERLRITVPAVKTRKLRARHELLKRVSSASRPRVAC